MKPRTLRDQLRRRGAELMRRWQNLVNFFGDGQVDVAEEIYPRLISYRRRAVRIVGKVRRMA